MMFANELKRGIVFAAIMMGAITAQAQSIGGICDANDPMSCVPGGTPTGGGGAPVDPNPYDPNNPEDPGYPGIPDVADRTILLGEQVNFQAIDVNQVIAGVLYDLPGFYLESVEVEVVRPDRNTVLDLIVDGRRVDSKRPYARRVTLDASGLLDVTSFGQRVEIGVRGRAFIREIRFHLVRGY